MLNDYETTPNGEFWRMHGRFLHCGRLIRDNSCITDFVSEQNHPDENALQNVFAAGNNRKLPSWTETTEQMSVVYRSNYA
ncbi:hypothetical protein TNCV_4903021 [Trichonephila clavipes]|nr:hypothetical protein TNCV_4903021 [Trichonephila clavipes]